MVTIIVGVGCFISGGILGAAIMAILTVAKNPNEAAETRMQQANKT